MASPGSSNFDSMNPEQLQQLSAKMLAEKVNNIQKTLNLVQRRLITQQHLVSREFENKIRNIYDSVINDINGVRNEVNTIGDTVAISGKYKTWTPIAPFRKGVLKSTNEKMRTGTNLKSSKSVDFVEFKNNDGETSNEARTTSSLCNRLSASTSCIDSKYGPRSLLPGYGCCFYGDSHTVPYRTFKARPSFYRDPRHSWGPSRCGSRSTLDDDDLCLDKGCMCGKVTDDWRVNVAPFMWDGWVIPGLEIDDVEKLRERLEKFEKFKTDSVDVHNEYRRGHGCPELVPSEQLSRDAQKWAEMIAIKGYAQYSESTSRGENIMVLDIEDDLCGRQVVDSWYREHTLYNYKQPRWQRGSSNFTQMIWKSSQYIGVGIVKYPYHDTYIIVAQYEPAGNINTPSKYRQNVPPPLETTNNITTPVEETANNATTSLTDTASIMTTPIDDTTDNVIIPVIDTASDMTPVIDCTARTLTAVDTTVSTVTTPVDDTKSNLTTLANDMRINVISSVDTELNMTTVEVDTTNNSMNSVRTQSSAQNNLDYRHSPNVEVDEGTDTNLITGMAGEVQKGQNVPSELQEQSHVNMITNTYSRKVNASEWDKARHAKSIVSTTCKSRDDQYDTSDSIYYDPDDVYNTFDSDFETDLRYDPTNADVKDNGLRFLHNKTRKEKDNDYANFMKNLNENEDHNNSIHLIDQTINETIHKPSLKKLHHQYETVGINEHLHKRNKNDNGMDDICRKKTFERTQHEHRGKEIKGNIEQGFFDLDIDDNSHMEEDPEENPYTSIGDIDIYLNKEADTQLSVNERRDKIIGKIVDTTAKPLDFDNPPMAQQSSSLDEAVYSTVKKVTRCKNKSNENKVDKDYVNTSERHGNDEKKYKMTNRKKTDKPKIRPVKPKRSSEPPRRKRRMSIESNV